MFLSTSNKTKMIILLISIIITASFLRGPIVSVGPMSDIIISELGITSAEFGLITTLPLLVFAFSSTTIPFVVSRFGLIKTVLGGATLIIIGSLLRSYDNYYILLLGTVIVGFGIVTISIIFGIILG